ncbi:Fic family protein [Phaeodactylibacter luteus]|uniref:Fic family protein n=1 Tax=Phaeodactylibacter luteus TaxID=1564516 RepID=A0A5C6RIU8_9BACT|nr:Fic family protein [Phaeodactylibacter luteus]TXB62221.1 Fic family protein [Phaeodactylibacter luteus]
MKVNRIWNYISFGQEWGNLDTSIVDDISQSWFSRRKVLAENSKEYEEFMSRLKRRHAIETGIVERMYDLDKGVTETLIKEGFVSSLVSHGDSNIDKSKLFGHLTDHLEAVDFVFDVVKENRPLTKGFILELHQLTTRNQEFAEGRDQFGNKTKIPLLKGKFKERENNPTRNDGTKILYCPPEHVEAEMDRLMILYEELVEKGVHPLIIATWFHHAFTTIHPFQDGNGRVVRLIASLILIKYNYFPITVLREEAKEKYIKALEKADTGEPQDLVTYFGEIQRRNIEEALNLREVASTSLEEVTNIFKRKIKDKREKERLAYQSMLAGKRMQIFSICSDFLNDYKLRLEQEFDNSVDFYIGSGKPDDTSKQHYYYHQIVAYASQHNYFFNRQLPKSYFIFGIDLKDGKKYELGISIHHYGYDDSAIAIGAFLEYKGVNIEDDSNSTIPLNLKPHIISVSDDIDSKERNINKHLENILTITMAQIASEI